MRQEKEGTLRLLTPGELRLARSVFGNAITYPKVWIHHGSYFPLGLQGKNTSMAPDGEIYFRNWYASDFSTQLAEYQHTFIHEMGHVWQRERGMHVMLRGLLSWGANYHYRLDNRLLWQYPMEQQAQIIADFFVLKTYGYQVWGRLWRNNHVTLDGDLSEDVIRHQYLHTLKGFPGR